MSLNTPVVFLIYRRPDLTGRVFHVIAQAEPAKLLVVADGPRSHEESENCMAARRIIERVDWPCELYTNYSDQNLGCRGRVSSGLDWVFSIVEEAIILEDDCLPSPSFFGFCQRLLEYYAHDQRVMHISGDNFQDPRGRMPFSYYFSRYAHCWGWATWRRAWTKYDVGMKTWPDFKIRGMLNWVCEDPIEAGYWSGIFDRVFEGSIDTWDYQWLYTCWSQGGLSLLPGSNLVSNLGFRDDATHTQSKIQPVELPSNNIWDIAHPPFVVRNREADTYTFNHHFGGAALRQEVQFRERLSRGLNKVKSFFISKD